MISSSDLPACPACGCRDVHPITKPVAVKRFAIEKLFDTVPAHPDDVITATNETFYACRQCGRDVTDAWKDVQPAPEPTPVIGPPEPIESIAVEAHRLGIGATNGEST